MLPLACQLQNPHATIADKFEYWFAGAFATYDFILTSPKLQLHFTFQPLRGSSSSYLRFLTAVIMGTPNTAHNNPDSPISAEIESTGASINYEALPWAGSTPQQEPSCISCSDEIEAVSFTAPCKHSYCNDCLASYVKNALEPAGLFPPACCNLPITLQSVQAHIHDELVKRWQKKQLEIVESCTLVCAKSGCRVVISPENIVEDLGHCLACNNHICTMCRMQAHKDEPCPNEDVMNLAKKEGWQRCYRCNNMIELNFGCNHMT